VRQFLRRLFAPHDPDDQGPLVGHSVALPRNVLASLLVTGTESLILPLLVEVLHVYYLLAVSGVMLAGATGAFFLNKYWVFEARRGRTRRQYLRQIGVAAGGYFANLALIWLLTEKLHVHYLISFLASAVVVFFGWNYPGSRWFVFWDARASASSRSTASAAGPRRARRSSWRRTAERS